MSSRIAVVNKGRLVQCDEPERLYKRPRTRFVAGFFRGCNVLDAEPIGHRNGHATFRLAGTAVEGVPLEGISAPGKDIAIRSENLHIGSLAEDYPCRIAGTLVETIYRGTVLDYLVNLPDGQKLVATTTRHVEVSPGSAVTVGFEPNAVIPLEG